jgi:hypothetical protein
MSRWLLALLCAAAIGLAACGRGGDAQRVASSSTPIRTLTATTTGAPVPAVATLPAFADQLAQWLQSIVTTAAPLAPLLGTPRPDDAQWQADVRETAAALRRAASERPDNPPACLADAATEAATVTTAWSQLADDLIAVAAAPNQERLHAAQRTFDENVVSIRAVPVELRRAQC